MSAQPNSYTGTLELYVPDFVVLGHSFYMTEETLLKIFLMLLSYSDC